MRCGPRSRSDDKYIYIRLEFDGTEQASAFKQFLETQVWTSQEASPGLDGTPSARVLTPVSTKSGTG